MPGMPSTPLAVEIGAIAGSTVRRLGPPAMAYSCQPSRSSTMSPTLKLGLCEATTSPTVPPVITSPMPTAAAYEAASRRRPRW